MQPRSQIRVSGKFLLLTLSDFLMNIKPIKTETQYDEALHRLDAIFDASPDTEEGNEAEILSLLIEDYEDRYYPIEAPDPIEVIKIETTRN